VRQFNAKITRTLKKNPELAPYLPERLTVQGLRDKIQTRQDFNREIKSARHFLKPGAETPVTSATGIRTTRWEKREIGIKVGVINRRRNRELKKMNPTTEKGTMGTIRENNLRPKKYDIDKIKASDWDMFVYGVEKQIMSGYTAQKNELYKQNFIKAVKTAFGSKGTEIVEMAQSIPADILVELYYNDPVLQVEFIYNPLEMQIKIDNIVEHLEPYAYGGADE
jgi:hypothetical protein